MERLRNAFEQAAAAAENLPDHLQPIAFDRALTWLLGNTREQGEGEPPVAEGPRSLGRGFQRGVGVYTSSAL